MGYKFYGPYDYDFDRRPDYYEDNEDCYTDPMDYLDGDDRDDYEYEIYGED